MMISISGMGVRRPRQVGQLQLRLLPLLLLPRVQLRQLRRPLLQLQLLRQWLWLVLLMLLKSGQ